MAQLILGTAGALIGGNIFHSAIAAQLGFAAGSVLAANILSDDRAVPASNLTDLRVTGVNYGEIIPWVQGTARLPGQIWWASDRRPIVHEEKQETGGKGGGGSVSYQWTTYDVDLIVGLTDNQANSLYRIWLNGKLAYNVADNASLDDLFNSFNTTFWDRMTFYPGDYDQMPDSVYEAALGPGNAPAYRGRSYVFFESLHLDQSGTIPNFSFEVVVNLPTPLRISYERPSVSIKHGVEASATYTAPYSTDLSLDYTLWGLAGPTLLTEFDNSPP